jgi:hypothetical protein
MKRDRSPQPHGTPKRRAKIIPRIAAHCGKHPGDGFSRGKLVALTDAKTAEALIEEARAPKPKAA